MREKDLLYTLRNPRRHKYGYTEVESKVHIRTRILLEKNMVGGDLIGYLSYCIRFVGADKNIDDFMLWVT